MARGSYFLFLFLSLGGCIPPAASPPQTSSDVDVPRLDPQLDTLFGEAPVWEMLPVVANARTVYENIYTVVAGDTLRSIGDKSGVGSETIARTNQLSAPFVIFPGQRLRITGGRYHKVSTGETGIAIARAYGTDWSTLIALNALTDPFTLRLGQRLLLPPGAAPTTAALEARAASFTLDIDDIVTGGEPASEIDGIASPAPGHSLPATTAVATPAGFNGKFSWPAVGVVAAKFGIAGEGAINQGIEVAVGRGADIVSAGDGVIAFVGDAVANYGGLILVKHGGGWITAYGRAARAAVTRGQTVTRGQVIGYAGTGTAPLLFFQIRKNRVPVDPLKQLPVR